MSIVSPQVVALGRSVMSNQIIATTDPQGFLYQQDQEDTFLATVGIGETLSISLRVKAVNVEAQRVYGYAGQSGFQVFNVPFDTDNDTTAAALVILLATAFPLLNVSVIGAVITITTDGNYGLMVEYEYFRHLTRTKVNEPFDLTTYKGPVILKGTVSGGNIRYKEYGAPTQTQGLIITDGNPFDIVGADNIIKALFIEETALAAVDYDISI